MKKNLVFIIISFFYFGNVQSIQPDVFVQSTVNRASQALNNQFSKKKR